MKKMNKYVVFGVFLVAIAVFVYALNADGDEIISEKPESLEGYSEAYFAGGCFLVCGIGF